MVKEAMALGQTDDGMTLAEAACGRTEKALRVQAEQLDARAEALREAVAELASWGEVPAPLSQWASAEEGASPVVPGSLDGWQRLRQARKAALAARAAVAEEIQSQIHAFAQTMDQLDAALTEYKASQNETNEGSEAELSASEPSASPASEPEALSPVPGGAPELEVPPRAPRANLETVVTFESEDNFYTGFSADISEGGLFVATINVQPVGTEVELKFSLPNGYTTKLTGEVRWVREWNDDTPDISPGMGIQFQTVDEITQQHIRGFIERRESIFYDLDVA